MDVDRSSSWATYSRKSLDKQGSSVLPYSSVPLAFRYRSFELSAHRGSLGEVAAAYQKSQRV